MRDLTRDTLCTIIASLCLIMFAACGDDTVYEEADCDPETDGAVCFCQDQDTGETCHVDDADCACAGGGDTAATNNGTSSNNGTPTTNNGAPNTSSGGGTTTPSTNNSSTIPNNNATGAGTTAGASDCRPSSDGPPCICLDAETGAVCDVDLRDDCVCSLTDSNNATQPSNNASTGDRYWRFVLIEDLSDSGSGEYPGIDVDAIEVVTELGLSYAATTIEDFNLGGGIARDVSQVLGEPDSDCDPSSGAFLSLGGRAAGGYVMVGFSTPTRDATFRAGSTITVHELGATMCGQFDDDPFSIAVSVSTDRASFTQLGTATGTTTIPVPANP